MSWTGKGEAKLPICNGRLPYDKCEKNTLSQEEPVKKEAAEPKKEKAPVETAPAAPAKNASEPNPMGAESVKKVVPTPPAAAAKEEPVTSAKPKIVVNATNGHDTAPRTKPICNGKNQGRCETHTLVHTKTFVEHRLTGSL
jgi:hypothetical protein